MGSTVQAIAGIALTIFAPVLAGMTHTIWAYGAVIVGATLVGASVLGSALSPDFEDIGGVEGYSGIKLQTQKTNLSPVPIIYGENRLAGNIIYQTTNAEVSNDDAANGYNRDYWALVVFTGHHVYGYSDIKAGDEALTTVDGIIQTSTSEYVHVKYFGSSSDIDIQSIDFVENEAGDYITGLALGLPSITIPANSYGWAVHQVYDQQQNKNTQLRSLTVTIKGKRIRTITNSTTISTATSYSINPAEIILDLLGDALSIADTDIDIASFYQAKLDCDTNSWDCNIALIQQANIQSIIQDILATCRGQIVHSDSKWKMKIDTKSQTSVATLTDDDFINNSLSISMKGSKEIANKIILKYVNPSDEWLAAQVMKEDSDLQDLDGQTIEKILDIKGITNQTQAEELAEITLNTMRYTEDASGNRIKQTPLAIAFSTTVKNADLEVGDIVSITHSILDRTRKFMLLSTETDQSGLIQITAREYAETHYKDSSGTYLI